MESAGGKVRLSAVRVADFRISLCHLRRRQTDPLWPSGHAFQPVVLSLLFIREPFAGDPGLGQPRPGKIIRFGVKSLPDLGNAGQGRHSDVGFKQVVIVPARPARWST